MKIYVVGSSKNKFLPLDNIREKFLIDQKHDGDNIDFLNPWYCELTGLYYLWKHVDDDIVGLEHYRRYFANEKNQILSENEIREILKEHDVIVCETLLKNVALKQFEESEGKPSRVNLFSIMYNSPSDLTKIIKQRLFIKSLISNNMFICKKELINEYCEYFFDVIKDIKLNDTNKRIIGFLSEYIFGSWLIFKEYKIKYRKIIFYK